MKDLFEGNFLPYQQNHYMGELLNYITKLMI